MTVRETIFLKEVARVISLMNPQFPGGLISLELNPEVLRYCPHVSDTELHVQSTFHLIKKRGIVAASHTIIDVPGQQAADTIPVKKEHSVINLTSDKSLLFQFSPQDLVKFISSLLDAI